MSAIPSTAADSGAGIVLIGTKAQFIKMAPVLLELDRQAVDYMLVYTGQHSETFEDLESVFGTRSADDVLVPGVEADSVLGLSGWALQFTKACIQRARKGAWKNAPWGIVHGDTASALLGALALRMARIPVVHIEAGLRSPRLLNPFPEELIRRVVSRLTKLHIAPDAEAARNLVGRQGRILVTDGNTLHDSLSLALSKHSLVNGIGGAGGYAIASLHRSENLTRRPTLDQLMETIAETARILPVRFVLHPVTRRKLQRTGWLSRLELEPGLTLVPRMDYVQFVGLMIGARFLMTDGGSNQEEAAMLGLPTILLRKVTERSDGLGKGVVLSELDDEQIRSFVAEYAGKNWEVRKLAARSPSSQIANALLHWPRTLPTQ
jgi:UDP-N-acetylglucosamine 2-epimerase (non-hydrolysing)